MIISNLAAVKIKQKVVDVPSFAEDAQIIVRRMTVKDKIRQQRLFKPYLDEDADDMPLNDFLQICLACTMINEDGEYLVPDDGAVFGIAELFDDETVDALWQAYLDLNPNKKETLDEKKD